MEAQLKVGSFSLTWGAAVRQAGVVWPPPPVLPRLACCSPGALPRPRLQALKHNNFPTLDHGIETLYRERPSCWRPAGAPELRRCEARPHTRCLAALPLLRRLCRLRPLPPVGCVLHCLPTAGGWAGAAVPHSRPHACRSGGLGLAAAALARSAVTPPRCPPPRSSDYFGVNLDLGQFERFRRGVGKRGGREGGCTEARAAVRSALAAAQLPHPLGSWETRAPPAPLLLQAHHVHALLLHPSGSVGLGGDEQPGGGRGRVGVPRARGKRLPA